MRGPVRALALVLLCTACIERPFAEPAAQARSQVDRSALWEVLGVAPPPDAVVVGAVFGNALCRRLSNPLPLILPEKLA